MSAGHSTGNDSPATRTWPWIVRLLLNHQRPALLGSVGAVGYLLSVLALPVLVGDAVNVIAYRRPYHQLWLVLGALLVLGGARAASGWLRKYQAAKLMAGIGADLRSQLFEHLQRLSVGYHDRVGVGQLMARYSSDVGFLEQVGALTPVLVQSVLMFIGGAVLLVALQPLLALPPLTVMIAFGAFTLLRGARPITPLARRMQNLSGGLTQFVEQQVRGIRVLKGHGCESLALGNGERRARDMRTVGVALARQYGHFVALATMAPATATLLVIGLGGWLGAQGRLSPGTLIAFVQYLGLLAGPIATVAQAVVIGPMATAGAERIREVLTAVPEVRDPVVPRPLPSANVRGRLTFRDVRFGYQPGRAVLDGVSVEIPAGSAVAFVGPSGAGKTTAALLVPRFYDPWSGAVELDGAAVGSLSLRELRRTVSVGFEDATVFSASIADNIRLGWAEASAADIERAARLAQADEFIRALPQGYETIIGEDGVELSGGQRQRIAIARAVLRDPAVLVLDDVASALDPLTEEAVRAGLASVMRGRTTILVAHRPATVALADQVVLFGNGRVIATGSHQQLLDLAAYREALGLQPAVALGSGR